jgi:hypothetical protein
MELILEQLLNMLKIELGKLSYKYGFACGPEELTYPCIVYNIRPYDINFTTGMNIETFYVKFNFYSKQTTPYELSTLTHDVEMHFDRKQFSVGDECFLICCTKISDGLLPTEEVEYSWAASQTYKITIYRIK